MRIIKLALLGSVLSLAACATPSGDTHSHDDSDTHSHGNAQAHTHAPADTIDTGTKGGIRKVSKEDCEIKTETQKYLGLVGKNVIVEMLWYDASPSVKQIRFPFQIIGHTDEGLIIVPHKFPMREVYMGVLFNSGHLSFKDNQTILDPCSAEITEEDPNNPYH